jgi:hypothetical protein
LKLSITFDRLRLEEKELKNEAEKMGCKSELIDVRKLAFNVTGKRAINGFGYWRTSGSRSSTPPRSPRPAEISW